MTWLFYPAERAPGNHWIEGWKGPRTCQDVVVREKQLHLLGIKSCHLAHILVTVLNGPLQQLMWYKWVN
jgi:hypothetical protein